VSAEASALSATEDNFPGDQSVATQPAGNNTTEFVGSVAVEAGEDDPPLQKDSITDAILQKKAIQLTRLLNTEDSAADLERYYKSTNMQILEKLCESLTIDLDNTGVSGAKSRKRAIFALLVQKV
jgi:hypothetical protein